MMRSKRILLILLFLTAALAVAQDSAVAPACGSAKVVLTNPEYLTTSLAIVAAEMPPTWVLDKSRKQPFYFFKHGENYESAETLMYINVERLEVPFRQAVQNDTKSFQSHCQPSDVQDEKKPELLEQGCEATTQLFACNRKQKGYVDLATKISIGGMLLNVVLSSETMEEIAKYRKDYEFLLRHLTVIN